MAVVLMDRLPFSRLQYLIMSFAYFELIVVTLMILSLVFCVAFDAEYWTQFTKIKIL